MLTNHKQFEGLSEIYSAAGSTLHVCQLLEMSFQYSIALLKDSTTNDIDGIFDEEFDSLSRKPLGSLIKLFKTEFSISDENILKIELALEKRNELAHDFFIKNIELLAKNNSRLQALNELKKLHSIIFEALLIMDTIVQDMMLKANLDPSQISLEAFLSIEN